MNQFPLDSTVWPKMFEALGVYRNSVGKPMMKHSNSDVGISRWRCKLTFLTSKENILLGYFSTLGSIIISVESQISLRTAIQYLFLHHAMVQTRSPLLPLSWRSARRRYEELRRSRKLRKSGISLSGLARSSVVEPGLTFFELPAFLPTPGPVTHTFILFYLKFFRSSLSFRFLGQKKTPYRSILDLIQNV